MPYRAIKLAITLSFVLAGCTKEDNNSRFVGTTDDAIDCTADDQCPPASRCIDGACECDDQPSCESNETLHCMPTHDLELNCLECECIPNGSLDCNTGDDCPIGARCTDGQCECDDPPSCEYPQTLHCVPSHDIRLNCEVCECI